MDTVPHYKYSFVNLRLLKIVMPRAGHGLGAKAYTRFRGQERAKCWVNGVCMLKV